MTILITPTIREGDMDCQLHRAFVQTVPPDSYEVHALYQCASGLMRYCHEHTIYADQKEIFRHRVCQGWSPAPPPGGPPITGP